MPTHSSTGLLWWRGAGAVALISSAIGAAIGLFHCEWQAIVEPAQVLAGVVEYPADNPYYHRHLQAWSLVSQVCAPFLAMGISEEALSIAVSGLLGALHSVAMALIVFALCRSFWLALVASVSVYYFFGTSLPYNSAYHIDMVGTIHSNGAVGQSVALLAVALAGLGRPRLAGFCCGVAPAVHPTWGLWAIGVTGLALIWERIERARRWTADETPQPTGDAAPRRVVAVFRSLCSILPSRGWGIGFAAGAAVTAASLGWQLWLARIIPHVSPEERARYLEAFLTMWDYHRTRQILPFEPGMLLVAASTLLSAAWLFRFRDSLSPDAARLLRILVVTGALSYTLAALTPWLPMLVVRAIPGRFMTLSLLAFPPALLGLLGIASGIAGVRILLAAHLLFLAAHHLVMPGLTWHVSATLAFGALGLVLCLDDRSAPARDRLPLWLSGLCAATFAIMASSVLGTSAAAKQFASIPYAEDAAIDAATEGSGVLIVAGDLPLMQLQTRRPALLNGWMLDDIVYFPNLGPASDRILQRVYGVDLLDPPAAIRQSLRGALLPDPEQWERRAREDWIDIGREYGATEVITPPNWDLDLPLVAESWRYRLYEIPGVAHSATGNSRSGSAANATPAGAGNPASFSGFRSRATSAATAASPRRRFGPPMKHRQPRT